MSKQKKFYVVWEGYHPGVYERWDDCKKEIDGFAKAKYKSFETLLAAHTAFRDGYALHIKQGTSPVEKTQEILQKLALLGKPLRSALAVDAACSGNPGSMEYRGVYVATGEQLFHIGPLEQGTNNVGEFLALVHGL
ncbi:MAG: hypothetical protein RI894_1086, partial [Bacteroidota bacterium]